MRQAQLPLGRLLAHGRSRVAARRQGVACSSTAPEYISSTSNALVKHCVRLRESTKYRSECGTLLLVGSTLIGEAAGGNALDAVVMLTRPQHDAGPLPGAPRLKVNAERTVHVSEQALKRITGLETVDKVDIVVEVPLPAFHDLVAPGAPRAVRVLALEGVQDPGNLGALLRTAAAFGWDAVHLLPGCCDPFNDKALRASRGAAFKLPLSRGPWSHLLQAARTHQLKLLAAQPDASPDAATSAEQAAGASPHPPQRPGYIDLTQQRATAPEGVCLVLGSEGQGLSQEALQHCTRLSIPMVASEMESLNVGTAGGILMFLLSGPAPALLRRLPELRPRPASTTGEPHTTTTTTSSSGGGGGGRSGSSGRGSRGRGRGTSSSSSSSSGGGALSRTKTRGDESVRDGVEGAGAVAVGKRHGAAARGEAVHHKARGGKGPARGDFRGSSKGLAARPDEVVWRK